MGAVFSQQEDIPYKNLLLSPLDSPVLGIRRFLYMFGPGGSQYIERHHAFGPPVPTQSISPSILYFYDVILLLILVHLFWGIGACIRPEDHEKLNGDINVLLAQARRWTVSAH